MFIEFEADKGGKVSFNVDQIVSVEPVAAPEGPLCNVFTADARATKIKGEYQKITDEIHMKTHVNKPSGLTNII